MRGKLARFVATGAYTGYAPVIPGTFGTLPGVALAPLFARLCAHSTALYALALLIAILIAVWAADIVVDQEANSDPQIIVVDEIVGYLLALGFLPHITLGSMLAAFLAFRVFDVIKPFPGRRLEHLPGGLGVVADDLWAGILARLVVCGLFVAGVL